MIDFNLEYYRAFYYVAQLNSVSKAADALYLSQPAVSRSIKMLEGHLNCKLFTRASRSMQLTKEGETLFSYVEKAFGHFVAAEKVLQQMANFEAGIINLGVTETALYHFLLPIIESFKEKYPDIHINVLGSSSPETIKLVRDGAVDLAITVTPIDDLNDLEVTEVLEFNDVFVATPQLMKKLNIQGKELSAKDLSELPIVAVEKGTSARKQIDLWFEGQGVFFAPDYSVRTSSMVMPFVLRNLAIGIMPRMFAGDLLLQHAIDEIPMKKPIPERRIIVVCKEESLMTPLPRYFLDFIEQTGS